MTDDQFDRSAGIGAEATPDGCHEQRGMTMFFPTMYDTLSIMVRYRLLNEKFTASYARADLKPIFPNNLIFTAATLFARIAETSHGPEES